MKTKILGIELGSTRIKSVLIDEAAEVLAQGAYEWKSTLSDGIWTYSMEEVRAGLQASYASLKADFKEKYGKPLTRVDAMGISAMMHGYLAMDEEGALVTPFRTWQNTNTAVAAEELSTLLDFHMPERWSASHFYQSVMDGEPHVSRVARMTTLSGYVHMLLTGEFVLGIGDASGMFPIRGNAYDPDMLTKLNERLAAYGYHTPFERLLPKILIAGDRGGTLKAEGALLLDPEGDLQAGCILCPPEGDAGTGMIATNSILPRTANVSAGTSAFLMAVLEKPLSEPYRQIDMVTTPMGDPVAMVHVNNFTSEINAWADLFAELLALCGSEADKGKLYDLLYREAEKGDGTCGGLVGYNFLAGEPIVEVPVGIPLMTRRPDGNLTLANFMKMQMYSALGSLALGMEILHREQVELDAVCGHGGFFKAGRVTQAAMSAALGAPVTVMTNAGEGGAWGMALLALLALAGDEPKAFLARVFRDTEQTTVSANEQEKKDFAAFLAPYEKGLAVERLAAELL